MLQGAAAMRGMGAYQAPNECEMYGSNPPPGCPGYGGGGDAPSGRGWDIANNILDFGSRLWSGYNAGTNTGSGGGGGGGGAVDNTVRNVLIGAGLLAAVGITVAIVSASNNKK